ncbi:MAG: hypothetical protein FJW20_04415 [Acidimicrobiia bacterium]|nr:hypothetical protein [Acidimicrobiia bacterium]
MSKNQRPPHTCFVPPGMEEEFERLQSELRRQFAPADFMEEMLFSQLLRAAWTLHRVEARLSGLDKAGRDPLAIPEEKLIRHYADLRTHQIHALKSLQRALRELRSQRASVARQKKIAAQAEQIRTPQPSKRKKEYVN